MRLYSLQRCLSLEIAVAEQLRHNPILYAFGFVVVSLHAIVFLLSSGIKDIYHRESGMRLDGLHCWRRLCRQQVTVRALTPFDRIAPMGNCETPRTFRKSPRQASTSLLQPLRFSVFPPCSFSLLPDKDFTTAQPLAACFSSPRVETVIIRLPALSAYHRLALPGLVSSSL